MTGGERGSGVARTGVVLILIGLAVAARRTFELPGSWMLVLAGTALVVFAAVVRVQRRS